MWVQTTFWEVDPLYGHAKPRIEWLNAVGIDLHVNLPGGGEDAWEKLMRRMLESPEFFIEWCTGRTQSRIRSGVVDS